MDLEVLLVEVVIEGWAVVTTVGLSEQVEISRGTEGAELCVEFWDSCEEGLKDMLYVFVYSVLVHHYMRLGELTHVAIAARSVVSMVPVLSGSESGHRPVAGNAVEL